MILEHDIDKLVHFKTIKRMKDSNKGAIATLIIGFRLQSTDPTRLENLLFLLRWIEYYFGSQFEVLLVEQDTQPQFNVNEYELSNRVRYEFLHNPREYNRGWGYNTSVRHFCQNSAVVVFMDTDVLPGENFLREVEACVEGKYEVVSPYQNIYYTSEEEAKNIRKTMDLSDLADSANLKNPVTFTGGIVIFDKKTFLALKGFEQYVGYGCEDRALDVTLLNMCDPSKLHISPVAYAHLWHPVDKAARKSWKDIYAHLEDNYKCSWHSELTYKDYIHSKCEHCSKEDNLRLIFRKARDFGDPLLYDATFELTSNGLRERGKDLDSESLIFPDQFEKLSDYAKNEVYKAPEADSSELSTLYNAFRGERCFIIGNGPSLNKHDLSLIENEYTFGVNSFYYKTRETGFRPFFYVVEDSSVMKENIDEIRDYYAPFKFFPTIYKNIHPEAANTFFFDMNRGFYEKSSPNYVVPRFSTDASREVFCGQSVTYINLQLAFFMGFTEVYLIGMDFDYVIPESHERNGDVLLSDTDDENHFHKDYFGKGKTWKDPKLERVGMNYKMAKLVYECVGRKIFNATVGGKLEIFERVKYEALFSESIPTGISSSEGQHDKFRAANTLNRNGEFESAMRLYILLAESAPTFHLYKQSAIDCYKRAEAHGTFLPEKMKKLVLSFSEEHVGRANNSG